MDGSTFPPKQIFNQSFEEDGGKIIFARLAKLAINNGSITSDRIYELLANDSEVEQGLDEAASHPDNAAKVADIGENAFRVQTLDTLTNYFIQTLKDTGILNPISVGQNAEDSGKKAAPIDFDTYEAIPDSYPAFIQPYLAANADARPDPAAIAPDVQERLRRAAAANPNAVDSPENTPFENYDLQASLIAPLQDLFQDGETSVRLSTAEINDLIRRIDTFTNVVAVTKDVMLEETDPADRDTLNARVDNLIEDIQASKADDVNGIFARERLGRIAKVTVRKADIDNLIDNVLKPIHADFQILHERALHPESVNDPDIDTLMAQYGSRAGYALTEEEDREQLEGLSIEEAIIVAQDKVQELSGGRLDRYLANDVALKVVRNIVDNGKADGVTFEGEKFVVEPQISADEALQSFFDNLPNSVADIFEGKSTNEARNALLDHLRSEHVISPTAATEAAEGIVSKMTDDGTLVTDGNGNFSYTGDAGATASPADNTPPLPEGADAVISRIVARYVGESGDGSPRPLVDDYMDQLQDAQFAYTERLEEILTALAEAGLADRSAEKNALTQEASAQQKPIFETVKGLQDEHTQQSEAESMLLKTLEGEEKKAKEVEQSQAAQLREDAIKAEMDKIRAIAQKHDADQRRIVAEEKAALTGAPDSVKALVDERDLIANIVRNEGQARQIEKLRMHHEAMLGVTDGALSASHLAVYADLTSKGYTLEGQIHPAGSDVISGYTLTNTDPKIGSFKIERKDDSIDVSFKPGKDKEANKLKAIEAANMMVANANHKPGDTLEFTLRGTAEQRAIMQAQIEKLASDRGITVQFIENTRTAFADKFAKLGGKSYETHLQEARSFVAQQNRTLAAPTVKRTMSFAEYTARQEEALGSSVSQVTGAADPKEADQFAAHAALYNRLVRDNGKSVATFETAVQELDRELGFTNDVKQPVETSAPDATDISPLDGSDAESDEPVVDTSELLAEHEGGELDADAAELAGILGEDDTPEAEASQEPATELAATLDSDDAEDDLDIPDPAAKLADDDDGAAPAETAIPADPEARSKTTLHEVQAADDAARAEGKAGAGDITGSGDSGDTAGAAGGAETPAVEAQTETPAKVKNTKPAAAVKRNLAKAEDGKSSYELAGYAKALATAVVKGNQALLADGQLPDDWEMPTAGDVQDEYRTLKQADGLDRISTSYDEGQDPLRALVKAGFANATGQDAGDLTDKQLRAMAEVLEQNGVTPEIAEQTIRRAANPRQRDDRSGGGAAAPQPSA